MMLPDCMIPDGADPCRGYHELRAENEQQQEQLRAVLAHVEELRAKVGRLKAESEGAVAECTRLNELFALKWDATQSAETEAARTEVGRLMNAIQRIDGINDYPANYSPGINAVCDEILRPHLKSKP